MPDLLERLGPDDVGAISRLCQRALPADALSEEELGTALFGGNPPAVVRGDPDVGVVASVRRRDAGWIRLLAVDPDHRRGGIGSALMGAATADLAGAGTITVGADAPDYLFPGVETAHVAALCLLEKLGYRRGVTNFNMDVDLRRLPPRPGHGASPASSADGPELERWLERHWPAWKDEGMRALGAGTLVLDRDGEGITGFCAWDVARRGWLGPIAVRRSAIGRGLGVPLLVEALHRMRDGGRSRCEIAWVGPIRFYARTVGATLGRAFVVHSRPAPPSAATTSKPAEP